MINKKVISKIKAAPKLPGVYYFYNKDTVIYVGKAIRLSERLKSYIDPKILSLYPKTNELISNSLDVKYTVCNNEVEALVLESNLIKKYQPKYNINLKDDKYFKYIKIEKQKDKSYKISVVRTKNKKGVYFGPFTEGRSVQIVLKNIRKLFPYRDCNTSKFNYYKNKNTPCLYGHIGLCAAPCQDVQNIDKNNANIEKIKLFLSGKYKKVINDLKKELNSLSKNSDFEKAIIVRDKLEYYDKLSTKYLNEVELLQNVGNLEDYKQNILSLFEILSGYFPLIKDNLEDRSKDFLIEFFDISNLGDKFIVGANISLLNGNFYKKGYRKYKIKTVQSQNDFYAMKEMITRRLKNLDKWGRPDLIVLDGGKGQLSVCIKLLEDANIPVIAIAKQEEEIYLRYKNKFYKIKLSKFNKALMVLIKGRNEVHRFVLSYNKNLRKL